MAMDLHTKRSCIGFLFCLLTAVFISVGWAGGKVCAEDIRVLNASGNLNLPLSVNPFAESEDFSSFLYDNRSGLPTSEANAIAQTGEGFIWIGSYAGLIRHDGNSFERIDSTTGISNVRCLFVDSQDRLWIGTNDSGVFLMEDGDFLKLDNEGPLKSACVRAITEDSNGIIYIGSAVGAAFIDSDLNVTMIPDKQITGQLVVGLRTDSNDVVYGNTTRGDLFTLKDGALLTFISSEECSVRNISCLLTDPVNPGFLYLGTTDSKVYYGNPNDGFDNMTVHDIAPLSSPECLEWMDDDLWICAKEGIGILDDDDFHLLDKVPMNNTVCHVMTDYEGNLWFTSRHQGVMKIVPNQFSDLFERYKLPEAVVNSTCMYGQQLFIGTDSGLIVTEGEEAIHSIPLSRAVTASGKDVDASDLIAYLKGARIRSIIRDSKYRLWISTFSSLGLIRYSQGEIVCFTTEDGLSSDIVRTVCECKDGSILATTSGGVDVIREDRVTAVYDEETGLASTEILTIAEGFNHELFFGSDGSGIFIVTESGIKHFGVDDGLGSEIILRIKPDKDNDIYWIITSNSLAYMTPDYQITTIRQFPYSNNYDLYKNNRGDIWLLSSNGIYVVTEKELLENEEINPIFFGIHSGLPYVPTPNSYSALTADNYLYVSGTAGVVKVNLDKPFTNLSKIKISLPFIDADGERYYPDDENTFTFRGRLRRITLHPYVFTSSLFDPQISYRLENFEITDTTVNRTELGSVDYTNLPNGTYFFTMRVKDPVGHTTRTASFRIVKEKLYSDSASGSIIMNLTSLLFMIGILMYGSLFRKLGRMNVRLFFAMVITNIVLSSATVLSYLLEVSPFSYVAAIMFLINTVYYAAVVFFAFLLLLYLDSLIYQNDTRFRKIKLLYGIPLLLFTAVLLINLDTGWIFTIEEGNVFHSGPFDELVYVPLIFYLLISLVRAYRIDPYLAFLGFVLIIFQAIGDILFRNITNAAFTYAMLLVCIYTYAINHPLDMEARYETDH